MNPNTKLLFVKNRYRSTLLFLILLLLLSSIFSVGLGAVKISLGQMVAILASKASLDLPWDYQKQQEAVFFAVRLPRVLLGLLIGAAISLSGAVMQAIFRNPLAEPSLVGVSSGAALGAVITVVVGINFFGIYSLSVAAFLTSLLVCTVIYKISKQLASPSAMLLVGVSINSLTSALTSFLTFNATDAQLRTITFWSLGSLGGATWESVTVVAVFISIPLVLLPKLANHLNIYLLGDAEALHLGIDSERLKKKVVILSTLAVGASVAVAGVIAFVGLIVPHLLRLLLGADYKKLLPTSLLLGASLLTVADLISRTVAAPAETPLGILTSLLGAPFLLWLIYKQKGEKYA